jgi:uncharacterized protein (TIGR02421 family)
MPKCKTAPESTWRRLRARVRERLARNEPVNARLPCGGRLRIDRQLPFLLIYRKPVHADIGTADLVTTEAAYLIAPGATELVGEVDELCRCIIAALQQHFGVVLVIEIWAAELDLQHPAPLLRRPTFEIVTHAADDLRHTINAFRESLEQVEFGGQSAQVTETQSPIIAPRKLTPLLAIDGRQDQSDAVAANCAVLGLGVQPIYRDSAAGTLYPLLLQRLRRRLSVAMRKAIAQFTGTRSPTAYPHFDMLGPLSVGKAAAHVDAQLCEIASSFDFLLQVSPLNSEQAWCEFHDDGCRKMPHLHYRPLPYRPSQLKRKLFAIRTDRVDDPTLAWLFSQKQVELDRQVTALRDINTPLFRYSSLQLFGRPDQQLIELAESILASSTEHRDRRPDQDLYLDAMAMASQARMEIDAYRQEQPSFEARVEVIDGVAAGLMVVEDKLLISTSFRVPPHRANPLLQHEVGTHLLTFFNGRTQSLRLLATGLAHCEELQEGLAVLAEYLSGGLSAARLRTLAARVVAVDSMLHEVPFEATYARLLRSYGLQPRVAFSTTLRTYRGGGLTKDGLYLRGLQRVLSYLNKGHDLEPLYVGKVALQHVPFLEELRRRGIVRAPLLLPRAWHSDNLRQRLDQCRGKTVLDLLKESLQCATTTSNGDKR